MREDVVEDVAGHLVDPAAGHDAADLRLLAEGDDVGRDAELLIGPGGAGHADAGLHLVHHEQRVELAAQHLHRLQELGAEVIVAALALDRLGDEAGDVVRVGLEGGARGGQCRSASAAATSDVAVDRRRRDARPVELGEARDLVRVGVGEAHRVAAAAVERLLQVQHLGAERGVDAVRLVPAATSSRRRP